MKARTAFWYLLSSIMNKPYIKGGPYPGFNDGV